MRTILWGLLWLGLASFSGCNQSAKSTVQPTDATSAVGTWNLSSPKVNFKITLQVALKSTEGNVAQYQLTGLSPVNSYGTDATVQSDGTATVGSVISTKRGGSEEAMSAETAYYNSLQRVNRVEIVSGKLQLRSADSNWSLLVFDKEQ